MTSKTKESFGGLPKGSGTTDSIGHVSGLDFSTPLKPLPTPTGVEVHHHG